MNLDMDTVFDSCGCTTLSTDAVAACTVIANNGVTVTCASTKCLSLLSSEEEQQQQQKEQQQQEIFQFLNKLMVAHDNAIVSYYQNRDFVSTRYVLVQILTDLQKIEQYHEHCNAMMIVRNVNESLLMFDKTNYSIRPQQTRMSNIRTTTSTTTSTSVSDDDVVDDRHPNTITEEGVESSSSSTSLLELHEQECAATEDDDGMSDDIYDGAILLGSSTNIELYEIAAVAMFNLALVHQQLYMDGDMYELHKAIRIYRQAITVLEGSVHISTCPTLQLLLCASYHNCAQMYLSESIVFDLYEASVLFDHVQNILSYIVTAHKTEQERLLKMNDVDDNSSKYIPNVVISIEFEQQLQFFYRNLIFARLSTKNGHSAAA
jgi:hypothetical protein